MINSYDERRDIIILKNEKEAVDYCVEHFISTANNAINDHGFFSVALSGGSTPKAIFQLLSEKENAKKVDFTKVFLFWSDERAVPLDDPSSNYKMAMDAGLKMLVPEDQIFPMNGIADLDYSARQYEATLNEIIPDNRLDLCMLGMGDDGHTASLFPHTKALSVKDRLVVKNEVPQKQCERLTLTFDAINAAKQIVIYVLGKGKAEMVKTVFEDPLESLEFPVQAVGSKESKALWIMDAAAANLLVTKSV